MGWIVIWVRRFLCLACGHTISRLPDWLHPWRWYAATVIVEALWRHCILQEGSARVIGVRFGRPVDALTWRSLYRWRFQILISPTLWGWLGPRLSIRKPAADIEQGRLYLERLLAEAGQRFNAEIEELKELASSVRRTLQDLVHNRKTAGNIRQFPPATQHKLRVIIVIDEAHLLPIQVLEQLHVLMNFVRDSKPWLSIVLVGLPDLRETLKRNVLD